MNDLFSIINDRVSLRVYDQRPISDGDLNQIINASLKSPTAGNMMTYSIIKIKKQTTKDQLSILCDNQSFIKNCDTILVYLADYKKTYDYFYNVCNLKDYIDNNNYREVKPNLSMFYLALSDAVIACQTAVLAAEALNVGSCYIGDCIENRDEVSRLLNLDKLTVPVAMITLGYYPENYKRNHNKKFDSQFMVYSEEYRSLTNDELVEMYQDKEKMISSVGKYENYAQYIFNRKFNTVFMHEMDQSIKAYLDAWEK